MFTQNLICALLYTLFMVYSRSPSFLNKNHSEKDRDVHFKNGVFQIFLFQIWFNLNRFLEINGSFRQKSEQSLFMLG